MSSENQLVDELTVAYGYIHQVVKLCGGTDPVIMDIRCHAQNARYHLDLASKYLAIEILKENKDKGDA